MHSFVQMPCNQIIGSFGTYTYYLNKIAPIKARRGYLQTKRKLHYWRIIEHLKELFK